MKIESSSIHTRIETQSNYSTTQIIKKVAAIALAIFGSFFCFSFLPTPLAILFSATFIIAAYKYTPKDDVTSSSSAIRSSSQSETFFSRIFSWLPSWPTSQPHSLSRPPSFTPLPIIPEDAAESSGDTESLHRTLDQGVPRSIISRAPLLDPSRHAPVATGQTTPLSRSGSLPTFRNGNHAPVGSRTSSSSTQILPPPLPPRPRTLTGLHAPVGVRNSKR
jgi:hypothetical protein